MTTLTHALPAVNLSLAGDLADDECTVDHAPAFEPTPEEREWWDAQTRDDADDDAGRDWDDEAAESAFMDAYERGLIFA